MPAVVGLIAEGELRNITEVHLGTGFKNRLGVVTTYPYPQGQQIHGFFGYEVLYGNANVASSWKRNAITLCYFRDALVKHECGGYFYPVVVNKRFQNYKCSNCGQIVRSPTRRGLVLFTRVNRYTGKAHAWRTECIVRGHRFRFKAIYNMKRGVDYVDEFVAMIKMAEEEGVRLGARVGKGKGLFELENVRFSKITTGDIKKRANDLKKKSGLTFHFISDVVGEAITPELILRSVKNAGKFFYPEYESYDNPFVRVAWKEQLPPRQLKRLHRKVGEEWVGKGVVVKKMVVPAGAKIRLEIADAEDMFYECLATAELLMGVGEETSVGKGEFVVV